MKKVVLLTCLLFFSLQVLAQKNQEDLLIESFLELNSVETSEDETELNRAIQKFDTQLIYTLENDEIRSFKNFKKGLDSLYTDFTFKESGDYKLFTLRNGFDRWNYILKNKKVVLKELKTFDYYHQVYPLDNDEFLLIKRMDEMSFSCCEVYIYRRKAKLTPRKALSVCSWTNVDNSRTGEKDPETGLYTVEGGMEYLKPLEIRFDPKRKIISYSFLSQIKWNPATQNGIPVKSSVRFLLRIDIQ